MDATGNRRFVSTESDAYLRLRESIVSGRLAPGSRVVESTLAERLGTSRTPVRSALHRLQQEGYVVAADGGLRTRLTVSPLTREDGRELFWIVGELEGMAVSWVAGLPSELRQPVAADLLRANQALLAASREDTPDPARIFDLHTRFHQRYVEACGAHRLQAMHASVKPQAERYRRLYSTATGSRIRASLEEHEDIVAAVAAGDPERAERAVRANWRNAAERLAKMIETIGEQGSW